ncbi:MAG: hypothetical protein GF393_08700 [Armatimonadia bacterium]|nr:hypothetical protein [Armatimonadia bacterium]
MIGEILGFAEIANNILDKFVEDKGAEAKREAQTLKAQIEAAAARYEAEHAERLAQIKVNEEQAAHPSMFVAGARPFVIWVGGVAFAYVLIVRDLLVLTVGMDPSTLPTIDTGLLVTVLGGVLGLGGLRSWEKSRGVDTKRISMPMRKPQR